MNITCPKCNAVNKFDAVDYIPGSTNTEECWRCGEELTFTVSGKAPDSATPPAAGNREVVQAKTKANQPAAVRNDDELEKAHLALEAERIRLEHRKMDHEREMSMLAQQQNETVIVQQQQRYGNAYVEIETKPRKDKTTAGLLAIFLGGFGVHKFYLGKSGQGIIYLLLCWTYIPGIIAFIEGIRYLCKNEEDFHANCY